MAVHVTHITNADSSTTAGYVATVPGKLIMDADAFFYMSGILLELDGGTWTAIINGKINWSPSPQTSFALYLAGAGPYRSSVTIGATAELAGYDAGVVASHATDITNKGTIRNVSPSTGSAISEYGGGAYKIVNSGTIAGVKGIYLAGAGTHTIINSGSITGATDALAADLGFTSVEKVTNSGIFTGDIDLGNGADSFTNFAKVKVNHKTVTKHGTVDGTIDLGDGNDSFNGGNNAETVRDGNGADSYKLGGGNDTFVATGATGTDGTDTVDGGAGTDTYDASGATSPVTINLDSTAHSPIPANRAITAGTTDKIFNFENVVGGVDSDTIYGNAAANHLSGGGGDDALSGLGGNDVLNGGFGNDHLYGGAGRDIMTGFSNSGSGNLETFHFQSVSDSGTTAATRDVITDFVTPSESGDGGYSIIDLSAIDANTTAAGPQGFIFSGLSQWHHTAGELRYVWTLTQTIVEADVNGDAKADFSVALDGQHTLTADDFTGVSLIAAPSPGTAPTTNHITNDNSGSYGLVAPVNQVGPGNLIMDADAWLISEASTIVLSGGPWTASIDGKVTSSNFAGGGNAAIYIYSYGGNDPWTLNLGATAEVSGFTAGVVALQQTNINNKGTILSLGTGSNAYGILGEGADDFTITNSGTIKSAHEAIHLNYQGLHPIINSGLIEGPTAISSGAGLEAVKNSGTIVGDVDLGSGADTFTDFIKVKVHGKFVTKHGTVDGTIDLGGDNDTFNGGNNAETVSDNLGADIYKFGGGDDVYFGGINGGLNGADTIDGGTGRDTYDLRSSGGVGGGPGYTINLDKIAHGGINPNTATYSGITDKVFNFEDVISDIHDDVIYGNAAANYLEGGVGIDTLYGLAGNDILIGGSNLDTLFGGEGNDILDGGLSSNHLYGGAGRDILIGGDFQGAGTIVKTFHFQSLSDSGVTAATRDVITDFSSGGGGPAGGFIDLSEIDAIKGTSANEDFTFIGFNKWNRTAGELRYVLTSTQTIIEADVNGDAKADFSIALDGHHTLTGTDFIGVI
jgi:Ca2+-binding RTX toxin-like protein